MIDKYEDKYSLSFDGFLEVYDFAYERMSALDNLTVLDVSIVTVLALHKLSADFNIKDIDITGAEQIPIREMPETAERLRTHLRLAFEKAIAKVEHGA